MLEGERSYQRGQENLVPSNNASSIPESQVIPKAQEKPWYIQHFTKLLIGFGLGGGAIALILPWMLWLFCGMSSGSSDQLRLHLLYVTGGIIAVLTLLQTNWKNQGDRLKIDADIKKNEQDSEKNERDHIRQVHAERRSRYTKAVEQLANEKASVRLGGIYTLVGLVDEWLADDIIDPEERQKEGQVIINNLCSYIRSPFPLALKAEMFGGDSEPANYEGDFTKDQAAFREEQDVRRTIFVEMSKRSSDVILDDDGKLIDTSLGTWSDFEFDFSRAPIFYPLKNLTIEQGNFASTRFYGKADFWGAKFIRNADFGGARFTGTVLFGVAEFAGTVLFRVAEFAGTIYFGGAKFTGNADFGGAKFIGDAHFLGAEFTGNAHFLGAKFTGDTDFHGTKFPGDTDFGGAKFTGNADFWVAEFTGTADFRKAEFTSKTSFKSAYFKKYAPPFAGVSGAARFSAQVNQEDYIFSLSRGSKPINCGTATLDGKSFEIPIRAVLFDPTSWDEDKQDYTRISEPAK